MEGKMKFNFTRWAIATALAVFLAMSANAAPTTWKIDPRHSDAGFAVTHLLISTVRGEFHGINGTVVFDDKDLSKSSVIVTIDATTVDTREPDRDKDLKSANFFDVAQFPTFTFKSTKVESAGAGKLRVTGDLTIHGITKSVVLDVDGPKAAIKDPWGMTRSAVSATTKINRKDFGITWAKTMDTGGAIVGDEVNITLDVEMVQPPAAK
jgi:polyisoprenoid-binding protein YceI